MRPRRDHHSERNEPPAEAPAAGPHTCFLMRPEKYRALADLFRSRGTDPQWCLRMLACPCDGGTRICSRQTAALLRATGEAMAAAEPFDSWYLRRELDRLGGSPTEPERAAVVPLEASAYLEVNPPRLERGLAEVYALLGYRMPGSGEQTPSHLSNELGFLAHCHQLGNAGMPGARRAAHSFVKDHMSHWATVCAAALERSAEHPVYRFAALSLEHMLACEIDLVDAPRGALPA